ACCILSLSALLVLCLTVMVSALMPRWFGVRLGENITEAQWVVSLLGISLAIQISFSAFGGVITGCHRWAIQNLINSGAQAAMVTAMVVALVMGGRLRVLAAINLVGMLLAGVTRVILAHRVCDGLRLRPSSVRWRAIRNVFVFGGKTLIPSVSNLLLNQTTSILIVAYLGPAALALYTRPRSLTYHIDALVRKMAMVLIPTTSSLQNTANLKGIQELLVKSVRYSLHMVLPIILVLVIFGGPIMQFWMGPRYANGILPAILAAGMLVALAQGPLMMILAGMNAHGRAGLGQLIASLCSVGLTVLALGFLKWGIIGVAVAVTLPLTILNMTYLPYLACQRVNLNVKHYFLSVASEPVLHTLPFALCALIARLVFRTQMLLSLVVCGAGIAILAILYWRRVLPNRLKNAIRRCSRCLLGLTGSLNETENQRVDPSLSSPQTDLDT
ncbi:MAG: oligosaccharide flippase family protein, partial [Sedimentisphaerales bacterium]